ncbi:MAG TPA: carboxypeptidase M32 [Phycisphaerales bacterium]|nr:carboxypeptidase M32 [Phycisphaerales bacterium]HMP37603.1 carboxypeptidase M32 [Phycisphaerales bacterium]
MTPATLTDSATAPPSAPYDRLLEAVREARLLESSASLLTWDQETMMPAAGVEHRARQVAQLTRMAHTSFTDPAIGELLDACDGEGLAGADSADPRAVNLREIRVAWERQTKLPASLVEEIALTTTRSRHEWGAARRESDFARFRPWLERIVALSRRRAECLGWPEGGEPWDALADEYEPGATAAEIAAIFDPLRARLSALVADIAAARRRPSNRFNELRLDVNDQERAVRFVAEAIGFDFGRGRLDRSTHPFCLSTHCNDVRLTTRFTEHCFNDALGSTMHEAGHGMYEQGLDPRFIGLPMGSATSLGIHESQSRMWENQVGRSRAFWTWLRPNLPRHFQGAQRAAVEAFSLEELYEAANIVEPGFIRVEADEATYNLHVMIRFELERAMMAGDLAVADVPGEWNRRYRDHLGLEVPDDRRGCLQDIHWSLGSIGYFPTYTLGNLLCAQLFEAAQRAIPGLDGQFAEGRFDDLRRWLNEHVHAHGMRYRSGELCRVVTGAALSAEPLMRHLEGKLRPLYGI